MTFPSSPSMITSRWVPPTSRFLDGLDPTLNYAWAGVACLALFIIYTSTRNKNFYDAIPAVGRTGFISSYLDAREYAKHSTPFILDGYNKYHPGIFRIPEMTRWTVIVSGSQYIEDMRKAPDDVLSFDLAIKQILPTAWMLGHRLGENHYHINVIRTQLIRNLGSVFSGLHEEIELAFHDNIPATDDWSKVKAYQTVMSVVSRAANRVFVGAPLCRDPDYLWLNVKFALDMIQGINVIRWIPVFLKPLATHLFTNAPQATRSSLKFFKPMVEERLQKIEEYGLDYPDKPQDLLSWFIDEAEGIERSPEHLAYRILLLNFAAIHTSSIALTFALFELASHPEYMEPLRQEVESVIAENGWTKIAMTHMRKIDSFLKEAVRVKSNDTSMMRVALKDFTFSDGTRVPKGTHLSAVSGPHHEDDTVYPDAKNFKGFRFSDMREEEGEGTKNQMVSTSPDFLLFGHGKHACPGRFFAVNELKAMFAHIVLTYDLKMTDIPRPTRSGAAVVPDMQTEVWFRKRRV